MALPRTSRFEGEARENAPPMNPPWEEEAALDPVGERWRTRLRLGEEVPAARDFKLELPGG